MSLIAVMSGMVKTDPKGYVARGLLGDHLSCVRFGIRAPGALTVSLARGNLAVSLGLAWLVAQSGVLSQAPQVDLLMKVAGTKMNLSGWELQVRGILCDWLVCLAVWTAGRTTNDAAKLDLIFWCLLAFVGSGFEHSIANQSLLGIALFLPHPGSVTWAGFLWNQTYVVLGNVIGGSVFVGGLHWLATVRLTGPYSQAKVVAASSVSSHPAQP
ncbi:MAG: formate/nitrite transporter family protein [Nitrospiraceae bacterium]